MNKNTFTAVKLGKGEMNVYDFGGIKLHAYKTNDFIDDEVFVVEKNGKAVIIESPCFFDNNKELTEYLKDIKPVIEENHMYIRIASSDFFSVSKDVVSKMISGEYDAGQAYQSFNSQLLEEETASEDIVLDSQKSYSNRFHSSGGNAAYSVMANTLRSIYGSDVLIATGNSFTGNVLKAGYTEKMAGDMIMPNDLLAYSSKMSLSLIHI